MVQSINLISGKDKQLCSFRKEHVHKISIDTLAIDTKPLTLQIIFNDNIKHIRNHDYTWVEVTSSHAANWHSPKIIKLENGQIIQANKQVGVWEIDKVKRHILYWHFNPRYSKPLAQYDSNNTKRIVDANLGTSKQVNLALLLAKDFAMELSRSKIPFSAVTCFTDHCDFDTLNNLIQQREFFKKYQIKLTKGFFLNHYSKHTETASFNEHIEEYKKWLEDGHELAYHALSQSIKPLSESLQDFQNFNPPLESIKTYIDHGFQPYNLSQYHNYEQIRTDYAKKIKEASIDTLWNYVDSGTAVRGVINQLNPNQFTLRTFIKGLENLGWKTQVSIFIKNTIFHYFNNDYSLRLYRYVARYFKTLKRKKSLKKHLELLTNGLRLVRLFIPIGLFWYNRKNNVYPLAKYAPVIFDHEISGKTFTVFQTLEMIDFKLGLCPNNLDLLIKEHGLFIAHTYFSAPMNYHQGKLFGKVGEIDAQVEKNFAYLSQKIKSQAIWNPTLTELISYLNQFRTVWFDCDSEGIISVHESDSLITRKVR